MNLLNDAGRELSTDLAASMLPWFSSKISVVVHGRFNNKLIPILNEADAMARRSIDQQEADDA